MKYFYIAVTVEQDKNESIFKERENKEYKAGFYSYVVKVSPSDNLKSQLERIGGLLHANIYPTKKQAAEVVQMWNNQHKLNNNYLFDTPNF